MQGGEGGVKVSFSVGEGLMQRLLEKNINTPDYWDEFHRQHRSGWDAAQDVCDVVSKSLPFPEASVMDVGIGSGHVMAIIKRARPDLVLYGCDHSPVAIEQLSSSPQFKELFVVDAAYPPVWWGDEKHTYDAVICTETLEHVDNPELVVNYLVQAARGLVVVTVPNADGIPSSNHVWRFTVRDLEELLGVYGDVSVREVKAGRILLATLRLR